MSFGGSFVNQAIGGLAVRNMDVALMAQMLQQQRMAGVAMTQLIAGNPAPHRPASAPAAENVPPPPPPKGAAESGKGGSVDVVA